MKSSFTLKFTACLLGFLFPSFLLSQDCPPGGLLIKTVFDITEFRQEYPNCKKIDGNLTIGWPDKVVQSLDGLSQIEEVVGDLTIGRQFYSTTSFSNLDGLQNIKKVGGDLNIIHNPELSNISALDNLESIGENLNISLNESLSNCDAEIICNYLDEPTGSITIISNQDGCNNIMEVASHCDVVLECLPYGNYFLKNQLQVDDFQSDFPNCLIIHGDLSISGTDINNLEGLNHIVSIEGSLHVLNTSVPNLQGLRMLESVGGYFNISGNHQLTNLGGLNNLSIIHKTVRIENNNSIANLSGLSELTNIGYDLCIRNNPSLKTLEGLNKLETVGQEGIIISANDSLISLAALKNLFSTPGINVQGNPHLSSLNGIDNIVSDSIGWMGIRDNVMLSECEVKSICDFLIFQDGSVNIENNKLGCNSVEEVIEACEDGSFTFISQSQIDEFQTAYPGLTSVEGDVTINGNDILNLDGLNAITGIEGILSINNNPKLISLNGLENLTSIGGQLLISDNAVLTDISGIANIEANTIDTLIVAENQLLSACDVSSICDFLIEQNGYSVIELNKVRCNSVSEIMEACYEWLSEDKPANELVIYPNPAVNKIDIISKSNRKIESVSIYSYIGHVALHNNLEPNRLDISMLKDGFYIIEVIVNNSKYREKLIIQ